MSWLLFLDESGHDHRTTPYEVRGGVALHASKVWPFAQEMQRLEVTSFGTQLHEFQKEIKGSKLLDKDRFRWAGQDNLMNESARHKHCRAFLTKGLERRQPSRDEFTAYGQACLEMARGLFELLREHQAKVFAVAIPRGIPKPKTEEAVYWLRKDKVFLLERYYYFLEAKQEHGLLVMVQVDKTDDRRFVARLERYFECSQKGRFRAKWIVPSPFFVSSDMTYPVQAADLVIYCVNWGFRLPNRGMNEPVRQEIAGEFGPWLNELQYRGESFNYEDGNVYRQFGIVYVEAPYNSQA